MIERLEAWPLSPFQAETFFSGLRKALCVAYLATSAATDGPFKAIRLQ